jgi:hypothetical protein
MAPPFWVANKGAGCSGPKRNDRFWHFSDVPPIWSPRLVSEAVRTKYDSIGAFRVVTHNKPRLKRSQFGESGSGVARIQSSGVWIVRVRINTCWPLILYLAMDVLAFCRKPIDDLLAEILFDP